MGEGGPGTSEQQPRDDVAGEEERNYDVPLGVDDRGEEISEVAEIALRWDAVANERATIGAFHHAR